MTDQHLADLGRQARRALAGHDTPPWVEVTEYPLVRRTRWVAHCQGCGSSMDVRQDKGDDEPPLVAVFRLGHHQHEPHTHGRAIESDWNQVCQCCGKRTVYDWAIGRPPAEVEGCPDCPPWS